MFTVKPLIVNTPEMWKLPNVNTISRSHLYLLHYEKNSEIWAPPTCTLLPWSKGVHLFKFSLYLRGIKECLCSKRPITICPRVKGWTCQGSLIWHQREVARGKDQSGLSNRLHYKETCAPACPETTFGLFVKLAYAGWAAGFISICYFIFSSETILSAANLIPRLRNTRPGILRCWPSRPSRTSPSWCWTRTGRAPPSLRTGTWSQVPRPIRHRKPRRRKWGGKERLQVPRPTGESKAVKRDCSNLDHRCLVRYAIVNLGGESEAVKRDCRHRNLITGASSHTPL